jgi:hypothetical protein
MVFDQGDAFRVTMTEQGVRNFKTRWPCSGLPDKPFMVVLEKDSLDVRDMTPGFEGEGAERLIRYCKIHAKVATLEVDDSIEGLEKDYFQE